MGCYPYFGLSNIRFANQLANAGAIRPCRFGGGLVLPLGNIVTYNRGPFVVGIRYPSTSVEVVDAEEKPLGNRVVTR